MEAHVVVQGDRVYAGVDPAAGEQRRQGGGEAQAALQLGVVQRLDAEPVARQYHPP